MRIIAAAVLLALTPAAFAAEGMWTLDNLPKDALAKQHGFSPDQAWLDHAMRSSVRLAGGCSGSFVSPDGLVLTNHHCAIGCIGDLSSKEHDYVNEGFLARARADEKQCPGMEINRLESIADVTARIHDATLGTSGKAYNDAKKAEQSKIEAECVGADAAHVRCDIVELYQGGVQHVYRYSRYQDVRLAFSPEYAAGFFGGDPDNFNFPRYNLDMSLLRVYRDGKPLHVDDYFTFNPAGAQEGELVMTLGHPGTTQRLLTVAQLEAQRDVVLPFRLMLSSEFRGLLLQFSALDAEHARIAQTDLVSVENGLKVRWGQFNALLQPQVMQAKRDAERELQQFVAGDAARAERYGDPWGDIAKAEVTYRNLYTELVMLESSRFQSPSVLEPGAGFQSQHIGWARALVRGAAERAKPDGQRLREYAEAGLPRAQALLLAETPVYPDYEKAKLAWSLSKLREKLGADHPFVRDLLATQSPEQLAAAIVDGSKLGDPAVRRALWEGGAEAIAASDDPAIALFRRIDPAARAIRARYEAEVEAIEKRSAERLAQARFAQKGTSVYPDATFSLRLSHGVIRGWDEKGQPVTPYTTLAGLFDRATGYEPFKLAPSWTKARASLDMQTRYNQVSTNDIIGGNSGSPVINAKGEIVGLAFDGNIHSLGGAFVYDETVNRMVSVHPAGMLQALEKVYGAKELAGELRGK